ncbi:MAG: sulfotransferase [Gammaproteobacteria bacterium]
MSTPDEDIFQISGTMDFFGRLICGNPGVWRGIGNFETAMLRDELDDTPINKPVYVTGLARSGSTILLEMLAGLQSTVSHCYKDFPPIYTPYAWNWLVDKAGPKEARAAERAHRDGIMVTADSPEAMEEVLWMAFFENVHNPVTSNVLDGATDNPKFEQFYREHIQKLLLVRGGDRYISKGNYQVTRLEYLLKIFPDARFVIPVRRPEAHIASLIKQHKLFSRGQQANQQAREHLRRVGHFEFGLDRRPINVGTEDRSSEIVALWQHGEELAGWAIYWAQIYDHLAGLLEQSPAVREASILIRYEDLCENPGEILGAMFRHCDLDIKDKQLTAVAERISAPTYYSANFTDAEQALIDKETRDTVTRLGYPD